MKFKVKIESALKVMNKNLKDHIVELKESNEVWVEKVKAGLDSLKESVDRKGIDAAHTEIHTLFYNKPQDNRKEYSKIIGAMEQALKAGQKILEIEEDEYDRIFNDNFSWRLASKTSNMSYKR